MAKKSKAADQQQRGEPNLGQKEARQDRESNAELRRMGEKSEGSIEKSQGEKGTKVTNK